MMLIVWLVVDLDDSACAAAGGMKWRQRAVVCAAAGTARARRRCGHGASTGRERMVSLGRLMTSLSSKLPVEWLELELSMHTEK